MPLTAPDSASDSATAVLEHSRRDRERYLCALTAPRAQQPGLAALIAFNQELARIPVSVSEPMLGKIKLQWWIDVVPGILQGRPPSHPVARALAEGRALLQDRSTQLRILAEARNFELEPDKPASLEALRVYAQATGGGLQALMLDVLEVDDQDARRAAEEVGTAWALIGLMRALPYPGPPSGGQRRDMLPDGVSVRDVLEHARDFLQTARRRSPPKAALPALIVARLADRHLKRLEAQGWDPAAREEPPAGIGAVATLWWGKRRGTF